MIETIPQIWWVAPISAILGLVIARVFFKKLLACPEGNDRMIEIAGYVKEGAMAYLKQQYRVIAIVFVIIFILLGILAKMGVQSPFVPFVFISGGIWSGICGYLGMKTATNASARTAAACQSSLNKGLTVAFRGGAVMGLLVVGIGLLDISLWFAALNYFYDHNIFGLGSMIAAKLGTSFSPTLAMGNAFQQLKLVSLTSGLLTYAMGASVMALFARVGGGIFTKAADVGADLVGKVEAGIPEDDPRNPATIADNVGDNVGDVAGMGADLYESYCGSILAATTLGASLALRNADIGINAVIAPMIVAGLGVLCSLIGIFFVRTKDGASQKDLLHSLLVGTGLASVLILICVAVLANAGVIPWGIFGSVVTGLMAGIIIGQVTEYYTSDTYKPTQAIAASSEEGVATNILSGLATGMMSTGIPVIVIVIAIIAAFGFSGGFIEVTGGIYGIAFAAIGMLSTLGIQLATDAFGPIADNAGGNAEMAKLPPEVRERTDALDSLGNTTAATGKGFAIGSAALTALALIATYLDSIKQWLGNLAGTGLHEIGEYVFTNQPNITNFQDGVISINQLNIEMIVHIFEINIINPKFLSGIFIGAMLAFVFCALTISAVGRAAAAMVTEVRRQFREIPGILEGTAKPEYAKCVEISTVGSLKAMIVPSLLAILAPIVVGLIFHVPGVIGLLTGVLTTGFSLAIMLNNSGGAWDNAKKYIESSGKHGGKGSDAHKAAVNGDTIGDPFKDTAGPSLNILIKLMTIVSIVFVGVILKFGLYF
jgi:K(+)-stimulated pyrophosphate-energized sodium pump